MLQHMSEFHGEGNFPGGKCEQTMYRVGHRRGTCLFVKTGGILLKFLLSESHLFDPQGLLFFQSLREKANIPGDKYGFKHPRID